MNLFDKLVEQALISTSSPSNLRLAVEKELLHHDILRELSQAGLLKDLTFMGGTCLRACYGARRLSEDLDFTGGKSFKKSDLENVAETLISRLENKYGLQIEVTEPRKEAGNTQTWKVKVITRPGRPDLPSQKINIDICAVPSYQKKPRMLINHYNIEMGTDGLILQCESREEILLNKIVALALRPNRIKNRDLWDIAWLQQQGCSIPLSLCSKKTADHHQDVEGFIQKLRARIDELEASNSQKGFFESEMKRFLPLDAAEQTIGKEGFWEYIVDAATEASKLVILEIGKSSPSKMNFPMS